MPAKTTQAKKPGAGDLKDILGKIGAQLDSRTVFGEAQVLEGRAIIPVASISYCGGGGFGEGEGPEGEGEGEGLGLGFGISAKPLGVIEVTADDTRWIPTVDAAKLVKIIAIAGVALVMMATCAARG